MNRVTSEKEKIEAKKRVRAIGYDVLKTYLIGAMGKTAAKDGGAGWRQQLTPILEQYGIQVLDPNKREKEKVGMDTLTFHQKLTGWKRSGNWNLYTEGHHKVWFGTDKILGDGELIHLPGDFDFVQVSDFLIAHIEKGDMPCGTYGEACLATYLGKSIYLVTKLPIYKISDSFLGWIRVSGGKVFETFSKLEQFLVLEYNLKKIKR